jgi:hypothetical protein
LGDLKADFFFGNGVGLGEKCPQPGKSLDNRAFSDFICPASLEMPRVFISYRQLDDAQRLRVRGFAEKVRDRGVDVVLDQFYKDAHPGGPAEGWPKWSSDQAIHTEFVLVIGNTPWFRCFDGTESPGVGLGAACEAGNLRQRIYDLAGNNEVIRVVYFDKVDVADISFDLKRYDRFHADDHFDQIIGWLGGSVAPPAPVSPPAPYVWPTRCTTFVPDMANRDEEFDFFAETLASPNGKRATLISGDSAHGKTKLVAQFEDYGRKALGTEYCSLVDFKGSGTVDHLLDTLALDLGHAVPGLGDRSPVKLRDGLRHATRPVLLIFDTFEKATEDAREFVLKNILSDLGRAPALRVLLASQPGHCPNPATESWEQHARRFSLGPIPDPQPWIEWADRRFRGRVTPDMVRTIVAANRGVPGPIADLLEVLAGYSDPERAQMGLPPTP